MDYDSSTNTVTVTGPHHVLGPNGIGAYGVNGSAHNVVGDFTLTMYKAPELGPTPLLPASADILAASGYGA